MSSGSRDGLGRQAWERAHAARARGEAGEARRWMERVWRLYPADDFVALTYGSLLLEIGAAAEARAILDKVADAFVSGEGAMALAACCLALGDEAGSVAALERALRARVVFPELEALADRVVARFGLAGWRGLAREGAGPVEGFVSEVAGGVAGWAWHPADPERAPVLVLEGPEGARDVVPSERIAVREVGALARPWLVAVADVRALGSPVVVRDVEGRALMGSPLALGARLRAGRTGRAIAGVVRPEVAVMVPVFRGVAETVACLRSVLASVGAGTAVIAVEDGSPEREMGAALAAFGAAIEVVRHAENRGFPAAANTGIAAAGVRDVVLLNSDTLVAPGWLERLRDAAYSGVDVASATPFSNDGGILGFPEPHGKDFRPDLAEVACVDGVAARVNAGEVAEIPVGVGFCLYLRRDALTQVGAFREDLFAQGYGEETEWCLRAGRAGWRHVAALDVFVGHVGGRSFGQGGAGAALRARNVAIVAGAYRGFAAGVARWEAADPLLVARRRIEAVRWAAAHRESGAAILVTHGMGGGVDEFVAGQAAAGGIVLVPAPGGCAVQGWAALRYAIPAELEALAALLAVARPVRMEVHHRLGHRDAVLGLASRLGVPVDWFVHDAAAFCHRIALLGPAGRYCGEPGLDGCAQCVAAQGSRVDEALSPGALVARSRAELGMAQRVVVPSEDWARRVVRHFPEVRPEVVPWEDDGTWKVTPGVTAGTVRVCVVGAIGREKGFDVLRACAADAQARGLPLAFTLVGHSEDDGALIEAGVFVTGRYRPKEAVGLIRRQGAQLAFLPSIWPETWCFALSRAWAAGLFAVAFDLGAQAERIRRTGRGVVLPLALPPGRVNEALVALARGSRAWHRPQPWREGP